MVLQKAQGLYTLDFVEQRLHDVFVATVGDNRGWHFKLVAALL